MYVLKAPFLGAREASFLCVFCKIVYVMYVTTSNITALASFARQLYARWEFPRSPTWLTMYYNL